MFRENQHSDSITLLKGIMNFYPYLSHPLTALGENLKYNFRVRPSVQKL